MTRRLTPAELIERDNAPYRPFQDAARVYAMAGYPVFLVHGVIPQPDGTFICQCHKAAECSSMGKHPAMRDWPNNATTDLDRLRGWFSFNGSPHPPNMGMVTGQRSGIFVLDIDVKHGGLESYEELQKELGKIPYTPTQRTASGGLHVLLKYPGPISTNKVGKLAPGIDIRSDNAQIVVFPSRNAKGTYRWEIPLSVTIADMPQAWIEKIRGLEELPSSHQRMSQQEYANRPPAEEGTYQHAVDSYNAAHREQSDQWPDAGGDCPICDHKGCFGRLKNSATTWYCFSQNHVGGGRPGNSGGWFGDQLDVEAADTGLSRTEILRRGGYLGNVVARAKAEVAKAEEAVALAKSDLKILQVETGYVSDSSESSTNAQPGTKKPTTSSKTSSLVSEFAGDGAGGDAEEDEPKRTIPSPDDFRFDANTGKWFQRRRGVAGWSEPLEDKSINQILLAGGIDKKALDGFKSSIPLHYGTAYIISSDDEMVHHEGFPVFNAYKPSTLKPIPGDWTPIRALIHNLVGHDDAALEYVLDWLAAPVIEVFNRRGHLRMGTAVVFWGDQGTGKTTLENIMKVIYGPENHKTLTQEDIQSNFNDLANKLFVVANEVASGEIRTESIGNKLKPWVTDADVRVEAKYVKSGSSHAYFNLMLTSNDRIPVKIEKTDRRFSVFKSKVLDPAIGEAVNDDLNGPKLMVAAFLYHLLSRTITIKRFKPYETAARDTMATASAPSHEKFVQAIIDYGWLSVSASWVDGTTEYEPRVATVGDGTWVLPATLSSVYNLFCKEHAIRPTSHMQATLMERIPGISDKSRRVSGMPRKVYRGIPMEGALPLDDPDDGPPPTPQAKKPDVQSDDIDLH